MLDISVEAKELYKSNNIPKNYDIYVPSLDLHINSPGANDKLVHGSFELNESLCSDKDLRFGSCEASEAKFIVADMLQDLKGSEITIDQDIGEYAIQFGKYKVDSCKKQDNLRYKEIIAYDNMTKIDVDVSAWYNGLFPTGNETYPLAQFRSLFLAYIGLNEDTSNLPLPNDSMTVPKTIEPTQISGRVVIEACEELNGAFGHTGRDGKFKHIVLKRMHHDYPQNDYPGSDYPEKRTL